MNIKYKKRERNEKRKANAQNERFLRFHLPFSLSFSAFAFALVWFLWQFPVCWLLSFVPVVLASTGFYGLLFKSHKIQHMSSICASHSRLSNWPVPLGAPIRSRRRLTTAELREILWAVKASARKWTRERGKEGWRGPNISGLGKSTEIDKWRDATKVRRELHKWFYNYVLCVECFSSNVCIICMCLWQNWLSLIHNWVGISALLVRICTHLIVCTAFYSRWSTPWQHHLRDPLALNSTGTAWRVLSLLYKLLGNETFAHLSVWFFKRHGSTSSKECNLIKQPFAWQ